MIVMGVGVEMRWSAGSTREWQDVAEMCRYKGIWGKISINRVGKIPIVNCCQ